MSEAVLPSNSMAAGCGQAKNFTTALLYDMLHRAHLADPRQGMVVDQYVDDLSQQAVGTTRQVAGSMHAGMKVIKEGSKRLKLTFSVKTTMLASTKELRDIMHADLEKLQVPHTVDDHVRDVGVDFRLSRAAPKPVMHGRWAKAKARQRRVKQAAKAVRSASNLHSAVVEASRAFGQQVWGMPTSKRSRARAEAAGSVTTVGKGRCTATVLLLKFGKKEPGFQALAGIVKEWILYWRANPTAHADTRMAWMGIWLKLKGMEARNRWRHCSGPMAAVITLLLELGWKAHAPDVWTDPKGCRWEMDDLSKPMHLKPLLNKLWVDHQKETMLKRAAEFRNGSGMRDGCDLTVLVANLRRLRRQKKFKEAGMLECIAAGATWPQARRHEQGYCMTPECPMPGCGYCEETELHRAYGCKPAMLKAEQWLVKRTAHFAALAEQGISEGFAAYWLRGIVPAAWTRLAPEPLEYVQVEAFGQAEGLAAGHRVRADMVGVDGTGTTNDPRTRRCCWSVVYLDQEKSSAANTAGISINYDLVLGGAWTGNLVGEQTVPRSELTALIQALDRTEGDVIVISDCASVVDGFNLGRYAAPDGENADLWYELSRALKQRGTGKVQVVKIESHLTAARLQQLACPYPLEWVVLNKLADFFAGVAGATHAVPEDILRKIADVDQQADLVIKRLLAANLAAAEHSATSTVSRRGGQVMERELQATKRAKLLASSGHSMGLDACKRRVCSRCSLGPGKNDYNRWLAQVPCGGQRMATPCGHQPGVLRLHTGQDVQVGMQKVHESHNVLTHRGLMWCTHCGAWATQVLKDLAGPCGGLGKTGRQNLARLGCGMPPKADVQWPLPEGEAFPWAAARASRTTREAVDSAAPAANRLGGLLDRVRAKERRASSTTPSTAVRAASTEGSA